MSLTTSNGLRAEHVVYDSYGQATIYAWPAWDVTGDGSVGVFDLTGVRDHLGTVSPAWHCPRRMSAVPVVPVQGGAPPTCL